MEFLYVSELDIVRHPAECNQHLVKTDLGASFLRELCEDIVHIQALRCELAHRLPKFFNRFSFLRVQRVDFGSNLVPHQWACGILMVSTSACLQEEVIIDRLLAAREMVHDLHGLAWLEGIPCDFKQGVREVFF